MPAVVLISGLPRSLLQDISFHPVELGLPGRQQVSDLAVIGDTAMAVKLLPSKSLHFDPG